MQTLLLACLAAAALAAPPNILLTVIDDLGFDDMGYRALKPQINTPNVDRFAAKGRLLDAYYVQPSCSPTRTTILSGRYPLHTGVNNYIPLGAPYALAQNETTLADMLKKAGYETHAVGKWHGGMYSYKVTPTFRGFNSFYGFYNGGEDYYTHMAGAGYDMRRDSSPNCGKGCSHVEVEARGNYSTILFTTEAVRVVREHDASKPLFLYLAYQAVHAPDQAPESYIEPYKSLGGKRSVYAGMLSCMDEGFGNVTRALEEKGMMDNTILIFTADNGGPSETCAVQGSSNWPLRGSKCSIWEGGTRASGFMWTGSKVEGGIPEGLQGKAYGNFMHAADWMPTLASAVRTSCPTCLKWDGVSQWAGLTTPDAPPPRDHIFYGITDSQVGIHGPAIRVGCHKLILGDGGKPGGWEPPPNSTWEFVEVTEDPSFETLRDRPFPDKNTTLLFDLCEDPNEHNPLPKNATTAKIIADLMDRVTAIWNTGTPGCPDKDCEGHAPAGCNNGDPTEIQGIKVWEPWCD